MCFPYLRELPHTPRSAGSETTTKPSTAYVQNCPGSFPFMDVMLSTLSLTPPAATRNSLQKFSFHFSGWSHWTCALIIHLHSATFSSLQRFFLVLSKFVLLLLLRTRKSGKCRNKENAEQRKFMCQGRLMGGGTDGLTPSSNHNCSRKSSSKNPNAPLHCSIASPHFLSARVILIRLFCVVDDLFFLAFPVIILGKSRRWMKRENDWWCSVSCFKRCRFLTPEMLHKSFKFFVCCVSKRQRIFIPASTSLSWVHPSRNPSRSFSFSSFYFQSHLKSESGSEIKLPPLLIKKLTTRRPLTQT